MSGGDLAARLQALEPAVEEGNKKELATMPGATEEAEFKGFSNGTKAEGSGGGAQAGPASEAGKQASGNNPNVGRLLQSLEHEVEIKLADQQADPNSPLYSAKTFEELNLAPELLKGLIEMRFLRPSKIQERALPLLLGDPPRNMIGQSQSGTGKTAAFVLTMLSRVTRDLKEPQAICIAPSRELARQILDVAQEMGKYTDITMILASKDSLPKGEKVNAQIVVGTPGTIKDILHTHKLAGSRDPVLASKSIKVLVIDEADVLIGTGGLGEQTISARNFIAQKKPQNDKEFQIVMFSATFPEHVQSYASRFAPNANEIRLKTEELTLEGIKQFYMDCNGEAHKYEVLVELYHLLTVGSSIIFVQHRRTADEIARRMNAEGHKVSLLHGAHDGQDRDRTIDEFRAGASKVLITTNVVARGIDISQVNLVINYDLPRDPAKGADAETYLHRIGRTGRFGKKGLSVNFVHDQQSFKDMMAIKLELQIPDDQLVQINASDFDAMESTLKAALKATKS